MEDIIEVLIFILRPWFGFILECSGAVTFSSFQHKHQIHVNATILQERGRTKRRIKRKDPDDGNQWLQFELVTMQGTCGWKVWDAYIGGANYFVQECKKHQPGWPIRRVTLLS